MPVMPRLRRQRGFTLVESLVALLVLSIGLLGVAALQLQGLRDNSTAYQRTQATFLAQDIADRMRANRVVALQNQYNLPMNAPVPIGNAVARDDILAWRAQIAAALPAGSSGLATDQPNGAIERIGATNRFQITIRWDDSRGAAPMQQFVMTTEI